MSCLFLLAHGGIVSAQEASTPPEEGVAPKGEHGTAPEGEHGVNVRMEIFLDENPHEFAYEIRGPLPNLDVVAYSAFGEYDQPHSEVDVTHYLNPGETFYLMVSDAGNNGIDEGFLRVSAYFDPDNAITLIEGRTDFGFGKVWTFTVPHIPLSLYTEPIEDEL
jgi:hypothetical protein